MTEINETSVKILFRFFNKVLDEWTVETLWADTIDSEKGLYKLDNIPFYAPAASDDIVYAEYDEAEEQLTYRETIEYSGNSTVQVVLMNAEADINKICDTFKEMGCLSEKLNDRYFAMEIPAEKDYTPIKQRLNKLEDIGFISYAEPCLGRNHY
jgi:hypothetical protein